MYCDVRGRPDPNGQYEIIDGKVSLRNGGHMGFELALMDSALFAQGGASAYATDAARLLLTDAEQDMIVARSRENHRLSHAYMASPPAFTDQDAATALNAAARQKAAYRASIVAAEASMPGLKAKCEAAYQASKEALRTAYRR
ncbi:hypothetical protein [Sphingomonas agri]|uniref:hypothetical protein n=1 Tax=Sphingomonas agri TaxID=1813878 RepID=UPI00311F55F1